MKRAILRSLVCVAVSLTNMAVGCARHEPQVFVRPVPVSAKAESTPSAESGPLQVKVIEPQEGATVAMVENITLQAEGQVPPSHRAYVVVTSPTGEFWATPASPAGDGKYRASVVFGQPRDTGMGLSFYVRGVLTAERLPYGHPIEPPAEALECDPVRVVRE